MSTYIILSNWTQEGIQWVKESQVRLDNIKRIFSDEGAELKDFYLVMGRYDTILIVSAPDDATMARLALAVGAAGAVRTETLKAFTEEEYRQIVSGVPRID